ncbi:MAG: phytoene/squalene synthase family protein [Thermodesulfobacteriota bacterium]|nr:phytoene/squalene synthase family protein [Thermodesulfobacteriota bacterium]
MQNHKKETLWSEDSWNRFEHNVRKEAISTKNDCQAWQTIVKASRKVMASYTTSFFIVTRFLPPSKRGMVEVIYAAVRYPDEVVDTFPLAAEECYDRLDRWEAGYELGLSCNTLLEALEKGVPSFVAAFTRVVLEKRIPHEYYRSFLAAMRHDIKPRSFKTLEDLIDNYIYGSAVVVGYFLAYIYGPSEDSKMEEVLACSRDMGIGLQLTNFLRDVNEDQRRGRLYLPLDMLGSAGVKANNPYDFCPLGELTHRKKVMKVIHQLAEISDSYYRKSLQRLEVFAPDCRVAIKACIDVYAKLNKYITVSSDSTSRRVSVSMREKFGALPFSKYWRLPMAMFGY